MSDITLQRNPTRTWVQRPFAALADTQRDLFTFYDSSRKRQTIKICTGLMFANNFADNRFDVCKQLRAIVNNNTLTEHNPRLCSTHFLHREQRVTLSCHLLHADQKSHNLCVKRTLLLHGSVLPTNPDRNSKIDVARSDSNSIGQIFQSRGNYPPTLERFASHCLTWRRGSLLLLVRATYSL